MSSESESDDDYVPEDKPEKLSEEESADDETEAQYENELEQKATKRKLVEESLRKNKRKTKSTSYNTKEEEENVAEKPVEHFDPIEEKKKEDDLWALFLDGTDTKPKVKNTTTVTSNNSTSTVLPPKPVANNTDTKDKIDNEKEKEKRIFEFAGETIVVEDNVIKERIKAGGCPATVSNLPTKTPGAGISGMLGALNKKNKLSILDKSKLDWTTHKKEEGTEEEIKNHNKGKQGYLERRDFLERADMRQYEIERNLRMSRRSNR